MLQDYIFDETRRILQKYQTRNPFELLRCMGVKLIMSDEYTRHGLKGFSTVQKRTKYVVINNKLNRYEKRVVAGHEGAHLILHMDEIMRSQSKMLRDFYLWDDSGKIENQANQFTADLMLDDDNVMDILLEGANDEYRDFFSTARELFVPPPLLAFKLYSMARRGYDVRPPIDLDSKFLGR
jgi:Zn-dependent peptidase ImmA (M78 family)